MSRLIDADALREQTEKDAEYAFKNEFLDLYYERKYLVQRIDEQPTACDIDTIIKELKDFIKTVDYMGFPSTQLRQALGIIYHYTKGVKDDKHTED